MQQSYIGKRFEFKYFLSPIQAAQIENYLSSKIGMSRDKNAANGGYYVNSLYFDTPEMRDYRDKDGSFLIRKKLRARMYDDCWHENLENVWLEVKHKRNMNIKKTRARINGDTWRNFITNNNVHTLLNSSEAQGGDESSDMLSFAHAHIRESYKPVAVVRYLRKAYLAQFTSLVRITFDYDIQTSSFEKSYSPHNMTPVSHNAVIMEVKFNDKLPWWFTDLIERFDIQRTDFSKYRNSVAVLRGTQRIPISK